METFEAGPSTGTTRDSTGEDGIQKDPQGFNETYTTGEGTTSKQPLHLGLHDRLELPSGIFDPVYEAKARVLNDAVSSAFSKLPARDTWLISNRFKRLVWAGINGSSSSSSASAGQVIIYGQSSRR